MVVRSRLFRLCNGKNLVTSPSLYVRMNVESYN